MAGDVSPTVTQRKRVRAWHIVTVGAVAALLTVHLFWRAGAFWSVALQMLGTLALVAFATWYFLSLLRHYDRQADAANAVIAELKLERDPAGETGNGGYPCESVWECHRGLFDGARIKWLKVWVGSAQRGGTVWIASTEVFPAFEQDFRIDASYSGEADPAPHPRLPAGRRLFWEPRAWVAAWLAGLTEETAAALRAFLGRDRHSVVTGRMVFCFLTELSGEGPPAAYGALKEMTALARLLADSASETNSFDIHTSFHYVRYREGKNTLELAIDPGEGSSWVFVPTAANWPKQVPEWATGRREEIVTRLRAHLGQGFVFRDS